AQDRRLWAAGMAAHRHRDGGGDARGREDRRRLPRQIMSAPHFERVALIGIGLINSSLARVLRRDKLADEIVACARRQETLDTATKLGLCDRTAIDPLAAVTGADLVVLGTPLSAYAGIAQAIAGALKPGVIVTDVGSVKQAVIRDVKPHMPAGV